jgi:hypothetical protein
MQSNPVEIFSLKIYTKLVQINEVFWPQIKYNVTGYLSAFGQYHQAFWHSSQGMLMSATPLFAKGV